MTQDAIIAKYLAGEAGAARVEAERAQLGDLAIRLATIDKEYSAGVAARDAKDTATAIAKFEFALNLDAQITRESGKYRRAMHKALSKLYVAVAEEKFGVSDLAGARAALTTALDHNGENTDARAKLDELNNATRTPYSASLTPRDDGRRQQRVALLDEKDRLLASMPSIGGPVAAIILTIVGATILTTVGVAVGWSGLAIGLIIGAEIVLCIIWGIVLGSNIASRVRINRRVSEIERTLERMSLAPGHWEPGGGLVVSRF
ncbi:MAG: hypothetical protein ACO1OB_12880 [Archangium sp.]